MPKVQHDCTASLDFCEQRVGDFFFLGYIHTFRHLDEIAFEARKHLLIVHELQL